MFQKHAHKSWCNSVWLKYYSGNKCFFCCFRLLCFILVEVFKVLQKLYRVPWTPSRLRVQHCHCRGLGHCCGTGLIPHLGTSTCHGHSKKKKKDNKTKQNESLQKLPNFANTHLYKRTFINEQHRKRGKFGQQVIKGKSSSPRTRSEESVKFLNPQKLSFRLFVFCFVSFFGNVSKVSES